VPGGVAFAWGIDQSAEAVRDLQALMERLNQLATDEQLKRELERIDHEHTRVEVETRQRIESAKLELVGLQKQRDRLRQLHEKGLVNDEVLAQTEQRMREIELMMTQAKEQMELRIKELMLTQQALVSKEALTERALAQQFREDQKLYAELLAQMRETRERQPSREQQAELERHMREMRDAIEAYKRVLEQSRTSELREARAREASEARRLAMRESGMLANTVPVTNASEAIRAGDVLAVEISGESDLPSAYAVHADGTVRLPILGSIKVAGLTAQQAGQAIAKQVSRVNSSAKVHVSLRRPRTEERRQR
jgi:tetratricopeptide (TPR) repeat protein